MKVSFANQPKMSSTLWAVKLSMGRALAARWLWVYTTHTETHARTPHCTTLHTLKHVVITLTVYSGAALH